MTLRKNSPSNALVVTISLVILIRWSSNEVAFAAPKNFEVKPTAVGTSVGSAVSSAEAAPAPPPGWELALPAEPKTSVSKKRAGPACCEFDTLCCSRQAEIDRIRRPALRTFALRFSDIAEPVVKESKKAGPPVEGFPPIRVVDGTGAPFPWRDGPKQFEIRIVPNGMFGYIRFGKGASSAHYGNPAQRDLGYGVTAPIVDTPDHGKSLLNGPLEYWMYNPGERGAVVLDHVKGKLQNSADIVVERWVHTTAVNAAEGVVHVYQATYDDKPYVFFLLPEVVVRFESKDALTFGGTSDDRFASDFPYTLYRFPLGPGHSDAVTCNLRAYEVRRWFARPKGAMILPEDLPIMTSMSQTSVETDPQIRIMFF